VHAQTASQEAGGEVSTKKLGGLLFEFSPDMKEFVNLPPSSLLEGSDSWAIEMGWVSVTPMRASFGEPPAEDVFPPGGTTQDRIWKIRLWVNINT
jgi:tubulin---tyrosine ligase